MRSRARHVSALMTLVVLMAAGCLAPAGEDAPGGGDVDPLSVRGPYVDPIDPGHDHTDLDAHAKSTDTVRKIGYSSLGDDAAVFSDFGEMDMHGDVAVVSAVHHGEPRRGAVVMVDVSDPANPTRLGYALIRDTAHPLDVKFDAAGAFVYASGMGQIYAFDVRDPANPVLAGTMLPPGAACHMTALGVVDGTEYLFCTGDPVGLTVYRIVEAGDARALVPAGHAPVGESPRTGGSLFGGFGAPHDMTFQEDPVDGTPILTVSNRQFGLRVLDVSDPATPVEIGRWEGEGAEYYSPHMHTGMVTVIGDTRYVIVSPEILAEGNPPAVWILDATDYGDLKLVGEWVIPGEYPSPGFTFTTHQWQVADGRLYLGYYHAGVWVLDLVEILKGDYKEDPDRPEILGYYLPHEAPVEEGQMVPNVWDLNLKDGLVYVTDIPSGLHVLHYVGDEIGDERITGFS